MPVALEIPDHSHYENACLGARSRPLSWLKTPHGAGGTPAPPDPIDVLRSAMVARGTLESKKNAALGKDALLSFDMALALGDQELSREEAEALMNGGEGLMLLRGEKALTEMSDDEIVDMVSLDIQRAGG